MSRNKNIVEKAELVKGKINHHYSISIGEAIEIEEKSDGILEIISNSFAFGYMQGMKAAKAEMKKGGVCHA